MLEIIGLILTSKEIKKLALRKGLKPSLWIVYSIISWITVEFIVVILGIILLQSRDLLALSLLGLISGFGGFLLIRSILQNKPDNTPDEDINRIGVDDLKP